MSNDAYISNIERIYDVLWSPELDRNDSENVIIDFCDLNLTIDDEVFYHSLIKKHFTQFFYIDGVNSVNLLNKIYTRVILPRVKYNAISNLIDECLKFELKNLKEHKAFLAYMLTRFSHLYNFLGNVEMRKIKAKTYKEANDLHALFNSGKKLKSILFKQNGRSTSIESKEIFDVIKSALNQSYPESIPLEKYASNLKEVDSEAKLLKDFINCFYNLIKELTEYSPKNEDQKIISDSNALFIAKLILITDAKFVQKDGSPFDLSIPFDVDLIEMRIRTYLSRK